MLHERYGNLFMRCFCFLNFSGSILQSLGTSLPNFLNPESIKKVLLYLTPSPRLSLTILNHSWNFKHFHSLWRRQRLSKKPPNKLHCDYRKKRMMTKNVFRPFQLSELLSLKNVKLCDFQMRKKVLIQLLTNFRCHQIKQKKRETNFSPSF